MIYRDRAHAGQELAKALERYRDDTDAIVIGLPRGGVVLGYEVARALGLPLDIVVPRKIGAQQDPEYAIGAIAEDGEAVWNEKERSMADPAYLMKAVADERAEASRRINHYRNGRAPLVLTGKTVLLVDDGVATGYTMRAAVRSVKAKGAKRVVVAVPHGSLEALTSLKSEVDDVIALDRPSWYTSVGSFYESFAQTTDAEVVSLLTGSKKP